VTIRWLLAKDLVGEMTLLIVPWSSAKAPACSLPTARDIALDLVGNRPPGYQDAAESVSCASPGHCGADGYYSDPPAEYTQPFVISES
jgi:hypothetical protein